jgi:hypothetical protein
MRILTCLYSAFLLAAAQSIIAAETVGTKPNPPQRVNILLIVADDLGYGDLGCYGASKIKTPNKDTKEGWGHGISVGGTKAHAAGPPWGQPYAKLGLANSDIDASGRVKADAPERQLYNLSTDPRQAMNLAPREPARADALAARLQAIVDDTMPPSPRPAKKESDVSPAPSAAATRLHPQYILINLSASEREDVMQRIARDFETPPGSPVRVGVGRIFSYFGRDRDRIEADLREFLRLSLTHDLPVLVALDGEYWLEGRPDLWNWWRPDRPGYDPANRELVEWTSWDPVDALKIAWLNWGRQIRVLPPQNLMHPRYRAACHEEMRRLVPIVLEWARSLPPEKKELFVGLKVGWESSIGVNKFYYPNGNALLDRPAADDPKTGIKATELPARGVVQIGYAAVKTAGIRSSGEITAADLAVVVRRHMADLAAEAARLGVPRDRLFTHGVGWKEGELLYDAAVNDSSSPGWSFYRHAKNPMADIGVQRALATSDAPHWAAIEWLYQGPNTTEAWRASLETTLAAPRCRFLCIFNWRQIAPKPAALDAIRAVISTGGNRSP